jgi:ferredoxin
VQCILACPTGSLTYHKPDFLARTPRSRAPAKPILLAKEKDAEPTLNMNERIGVARLTRPEACLAIQGKGFKGQARGADFKGMLRYMDVDRWKPIKVSDHPYDVAECDLCVRECPIKGAISIETVFAPDGSKRKSPVVHEPCVGCGVCEMICPVEPTASPSKPARSGKYERRPETPIYEQIKVMFGCEPSKPEKITRPPRNSLLQEGQSRPDRGEAACPRPRRAKNTKWRNRRWAT